MKELAQYTDEELEQVANQKDLSSYSDEELAKIAGEETTPLSYEEETMQKEQERRTRLLSEGNRITKFMLGITPRSIISPDWTGIKSPEDIPDIAAKANPLTLATKPLEFLPQTAKPATQFSKELLYTSIPTPAMALGVMAPSVIKGASPAFSKAMQITQESPLGKGAGLIKEFLGTAPKNIGAGAKRIARPFINLKTLRGKGQTEITKDIDKLTEEMGIARGAKTSALEIIEADIKSQKTLIGHEKERAIDILTKQKSGLQSELESQKIILKGKLDLAKDAFAKNKQSLLGTLQDDAEQGTLWAKPRIREYRTANNSIYKEKLNEAEATIRKKGDINLQKAREILVGAQEEADTDFLIYGEPKKRLDNLIKNKYALPKETEEGVSEFFEIPKEKGKSLIGWVRKAGGIDPAKVKDYNISEDFTQSGLGTTLKKGGRSIDDLAKSAQAEGVIPTIPNENPGDTLIRLMKERYSYGTSVDYSKMAFGKGEKTFSFKEFKADLDHVFHSAEYGKLETADDIPSDILRKHWGQYIAENVPEFQEVQAAQSETIEIVKFADKYFQPYKKETERGLNFLKSFGLGKVNPAKANKVRENMVKELEQRIIKEGEQSKFSKVIETQKKLEFAESEKILTERKINDQIGQIAIETQKKLELIDNEMSVTKKQIADRIEQLDLSSFGLKTQVQKDLDKKLFDLGNLRKIEEIKLSNRIKAEVLAKWLASGALTLSGLGGWRWLAGRFPTNQ